MLAYISHDLDDALADAYIELQDVGASSPVLAKILDEADLAWANQGRATWPESEHGLLVRRALIARLIRACVVDVESETLEAISQLALETPESVRATQDRVVKQSSQYSQVTRSLLNLLLSRYYRSESVHLADERAERLVRELFDTLLDRSDELPTRFRRPKAELALSVANYLASLNDRSAMDLARKLGVADASAVRHSGL
jgi:dGTP triphosphohydrolase